MPLKLLGSLLTFLKMQVRIRRPLFLLLINNYSIPLIQMKTLFQENQRFNQLWLKVILVIPIIIALAGLYQQVVKGIPFGSKPMSNLGLVILLVFSLGLFLFFQMMCLQTRIDSEGISMHLRPLSKKRIPWSSVKTAEVLDYGFVGGWGIRLNTQYGTVYNIRGKTGLALTLTNGKKLLIGTQKEHQLSQVIAQWKQGFKA